MESLSYIWYTLKLDFKMESLSWKLAEIIWIFFIKFWETFYIRSAGMILLNKETDFTSI